MELRDYQIEMLGRLRSAWAEGKRSVMVQMPTGTGKTVVMGAVIKEGLSPDPSPVREGGRLARSGDVKEGRVRVLIVAHRRELIEQIKETIEKLNHFVNVNTESTEGTEDTEKFFKRALGPKGTLDTSRSSQGAERKIERFLNGQASKLERKSGGVNIRVESIQKLTSMMKGGGQNDHVQGSILNSQFDLIVIDEAHHALAKTYRMLWERWPQARFLGLTATPCRLNGAPFTDLFDVLLQSQDIQKFIEQGWLSDFEYVSASPDSEELKLIRTMKKRGADGDYQMKEMATVLDVPESIEHLYTSYNTYARGKKGIVYAIDRAHAQHIAEYYTAKGVRCAVIDAKTPSSERLQLVQAFREQRLDVLINVDIFSEGFDCPEVEFIQLARPTLSLAKYLQQVGRGMRVSKGKPFVTILDNVGLYQTFGLPTIDRDWQRMFLGKEAGKGEPGMSRCIVDDEQEDKELVNLQMVRIKREGQKHVGVEVFLQGGRYGIMRNGKVTCPARFKRVDRLPQQTGFFALARYMTRNKSDFDNLVEVTTVIDKQGRDRQVTLYGVVSWKHGCFVGTQESQHSIAVTYWDPVGNAYYDGFPNFRTVAGVEIGFTHQCYSLETSYNRLRVSTGKVNPHFHEWEMAYNQDIVIARDYLIVKGDRNHSYRICGYLEDSIIVESDEQLGYQQFFTDGRKGGFFPQRPPGLHKILDRSRLGLKQVKAG